MPGVLTVSPLVDPANYDKIVCAGVTNSGICDVSNAERSYKWDVKASAGSEGQTITYRGWDLAKPKVKFKLWTDEQIRFWYEQFLPALSYEADKSAPKPFDVYHPKLFANQILWLVTEKVGDLIDEGNQLWTVTCEFLEYRQAKAKNATTTPTTANTSQNGTATKPTVLDDEDREIIRLRNILERPQ